jgi:CDP-glycerol glycerophosphotransferase
MTRNANRATGKDVILWGVCSYAGAYKRALERAGFRVLFFVDLYKHGKLFKGIRVVSPQNFQSIESAYLNVPLVVTAHSESGENRFEQVDNYIRNYLKLQSIPCHPDSFRTHLKSRLNLFRLDLFSAVSSRVFSCRHVAPQLLFRSLATLIPKKPRQTVVFGRHRGQFLDNSKHFYLSLYHDNHSIRDRIAFITERKDVLDQLKEHNLPVFFYPSLAAVWFLLRSQVCVSDDRMWIEGYKLDILYKALKVQLWHGVPLKRLDYIAGKFRHYDVLLSTSRFFSRTVYDKVFDAKRTVVAGYPRNDMLISDTNQLPQSLSDIGSDKETLSILRRARSNGKKIVLYAPTYRMAGLDANPVLEELLSSVTPLAEKHDFLFVLKLHPGIHLADSSLSSERIIRFEKEADISPLLLETDLLITDYSSVYFDFLLLNRPIVFFPYDLNLYAQKDLGLRFDYHKMTPGPVCTTIQELLKALVCQLGASSDAYSNHQQDRILTRAFDDIGGRSTEKIWNFIEKTLASKGQ